MFSSSLVYTVVIDEDIILDQVGNYTVMGGIIVSRIDKSLVEITVDNCKEPIVLAVECEIRRVYDHEIKKHVETDMLKFSIRRPLAGRVQAHGLFGNSTSYPHSIMYYQHSITLRVYPQRPFSSLFCLVV